MKNCIMITGGRVDLFTLQSIIDRHLEDSCIIAVDKGLESCRKLGIIPDIVVGDFDSANSKVVAYYRKLAKIKTGMQFVNLETHKDFTDTHVGILHAMEIGAENIYIVGATGTRIDHTMANIGLLKVCCDKGVNAWIEDDHNLITMISEGRQINKIEGYDYISFVPYGGVVTGVTLTGFEYNVQDRTFEIADSLGISNKIVSDDAQIEMEQGYMIVNYSTD